VVAGEGDFATDPTSAPTPPATGPTCVEGSRQDQLNAWLDAQGYTSLPEALEELEELSQIPVPPPCSEPVIPKPQDLPVTFEAPGWGCDDPADDKFICAKGAASVLVVVRAATSHDAYLHDPDKAVPGGYVSDVHDGVFATLEVSGGAETADALG
ncbi:hypothetical protein, partial [Escherichia coli]|uniref:hypothetical protein n=1 Tax=Escherichia coli TaxID=562 RepID=UPI001360487B